MAKLIDLTGQRFGKLTALRPCAEDRRRWHCLCDCGKETIALSGNFKRGTTTSCGCAWEAAITKHGDAGTPERKAWESMLRRCANPEHRDWKNYGGRGIAVCERWSGADGYQNFLADMGRRPEGRYSLDRIDNDKGYGPDNCRWATYVVQLNNTRQNCFLTHNGETLTIAQWERRLGLKPRALYQRIKRGWSVERALMTPFQKQ